MDKTLIGLLVILSVNIIACTTTLKAQGPDTAQIMINELRTLRTTINQLPFTTKERTELKSLINGAISNTDVHRDSIPDRYVESVRKLTSYSISILGRPGSGQVKHMQYLSKDIERKFKRTGDHINVGKLLKLVPVEVATVDTASKPVSNLNVHYTSIASKIDYNFPEYTFQNLTSPASEGMVPGLYMMWVTRGNDRRPLSEKMVDVDPAKSNKIRMPVRYAP